MKAIKITIRKESDTYIALFNHCGGGTQGHSLSELLDNCKEVLELTLCPVCSNPLMGKEHKRKGQKFGMCSKCWDKAGKFGGVQ